MKTNSLTLFAAVLLCAPFTGAQAIESPKLIPPWTPVTVKTDASGVEVGVWGRSHKLTRALPHSIVTAGSEILAAPIRLVGNVSGKPIEWKRGGNFVFRADKSHAIVTGWQAGDDLIVDTTTRIEFDGLMRVDLVVLPQRKMTPKLEQLWLEVPIKRERASLFHYFPGQWGKSKNSGELPEAGLTLPFKPFVWLGREDSGLGWFAESDKGWQPQAADRAIEVVVQGSEVLLRVRLLDSTVRLPITFTFGFQATPVKPWPKDFHEWRIWHVPQLGVGSTLPMPKEWWLCHRAFPDRNALATLDRGAKLGAKTAVFHEDWVPIQNYPMTFPGNEFKRIVSMCHRRGMKVLVYHGYEFSPLAPEWAELHDEILVKNSKGDITPGWYRHPEQRDFKVCYNSIWRNRLADGIEQAQKRYGFDGVYLDGTVEPWACCNERHGCGYRAADGTLRPTYPIFGVRQFMQRLYAMCHSRGGIVNAHQSTCCATPTLAFADSYWDGEQFAGGELSGDPLKNLPLGALRTEFMGRNFGVPCEFLAYERPPQWTFDHALAFSMLHDVRVRPCGIASLEKMSPIWNTMTRFGVGKAEWHPYWETKPLATAQPESVKVSLYARPGVKGKGGRALLVVSTLSADQPATAQVTVDFRRIGVAAKTATDALSREKLSCSNGKLTVPLQPMRMRMVWVE
ncbi:MAG: glycoside hydrolase domain-containing protein [Verrucomicrobiia bacterium]